MRAFTLHLQDATCYERIEGVTSFVGADPSGSFGIFAGHDRMMTVLVFGLAKFRLGEGPWTYLALPEALLYFVDNEMTVSTRRFLRDENYERICQDLEERLRAEEQDLLTMKETLRRLQDELFRHLWQLGRSRGPG